MLAEMFGVMVAAKMAVMKVVVEVVVVEEKVLVIMTLEVVLVTFEAGNGGTWVALVATRVTKDTETEVETAELIPPCCECSELMLCTLPARHSDLDPGIATRGPPWHGLTHRCQGPASGGNLGLREGWLAGGDAWGCPCSRVPCSEGKRIGHNLNHNGVVAGAT
ncbi:unnamed protein product [Boreogadus saida]